MHTPWEKDLPETFSLNQRTWNQYFVVHTPFKNTYVYYPINSKDSQDATKRRPFRLTQRISLESFQHIPTIHGTVLYEKEAEGDPITKIQFSLYNLPDWKHAIHALTDKFESVKLFAETLEK